MQRAVQTHTALTRAAIVGRGCDRHLLGLRCMMQAENNEHHKLFEDSMFRCSQTWKLSTSALSAGDQFRGTGFGTPEHAFPLSSYVLRPSSFDLDVHLVSSVSTGSAAPLSLSFPLPLPLRFFFPPLVPSPEPTRTPTGWPGFTCVSLCIRSSSANDPLAH